MTWFQQLNLAWIECVDLQVTQAAFAFIPSTCRARYAEVSAMLAKMMALPEVVAWYSTRSPDPLAGGVVGIV
jgi:hypothetical protein